MMIENCPFCSVSFLTIFLIVFFFQAKVKTTNWNNIENHTVIHATVRQMSWLAAHRVHSVNPIWRLAFIIGDTFRAALDGPSIGFSRRHNLPSCILVFSLNFIHRIKFNASRRSNQPSEIMPRQLLAVSEYDWKIPFAVIDGAGNHFEMLETKVKL